MESSFDYTFYLIQSKHEPGLFNYVGSTKNLSNRKSQHKHDCNNESSDIKLYQMIRRNGGWNSFEVIELEHHHFNDKQAHEYEQQLIEQIQPTMNSYKAYTGLSRTEYEKQYYKQWRIDNAEKYKQYCKQWRIDNVEQIKQNNKQYRIDNAEQIKQYQKQYQIDNAEHLKQKYTCECGGSYTTHHKTTHQKTKLHLAWNLSQLKN